MSDKNVRLKHDGNILYPQTKLENIQSSTGTFNSVDAGLIYLTTAPTQNNTNGIKIVILNEEPTTRYDGYLYIILDNEEA